MKNIALPTCAFILLSVTAHALPEYPRLVREDLGLPPAPDNCTWCHTGTTGLKGTAIKPFARTLEQYGVSGTLDAQILAAALREDERCQVDSDGDGVDDITEIRKATDPNDGHGAPLSMCGDVYSGPLPQTGCAFGGRSFPTPVPGVAAGLLIVWVLKRRAKRSQLQS